MHGFQLCADHKLHLPVIQRLEHIEETGHASSSRHGSGFALLGCRSTSPFQCVRTLLKVLRCIVQQMEI
jgi:hypothetical protein